MAARDVLTLFEHEGVYFTTVFGSHKSEAPESVDGFFEALGPEGVGALEACFSGHDHVNNGIVRYDGVLLGYNYSIDNLAYSNICRYGAQRGCTVFTLRQDGDWSYVRKNAYRDYDIDPDRFYDVAYDTPMYPDWAPPQN
jgi:hypothetical protein